MAHRYVGYVSGPHLVRLVDRSAAQKVRIDLVPGMPLAGVPLRPDRPQPELPHQPPHAPAADRNPLPQQRHLQPAAAIDWVVGENPVEPLQKLEFRRRFRDHATAAEHRASRTQTFQVWAEICSMGWS